MNNSIVTQGPRTAEFLMSEGNGERSREQIILLKGTKAFAPGEILSKNAAGKYVAFVEPAAGATAEVAILYEGRPADNTGDRLATGVVRDCEVIESLLVGLTDPAKVALAAAGIILR